MVLDFYLTHNIKFMKIKCKKYFKNGARHKFITSI